MAGYKHVPRGADEVPAVGSYHDPLGKPSGQIQPNKSDRSIPDNPSGVCFQKMHSSTGHEPSPIGGPSGAKTEGGEKISHGAKP